MTDTRYLILAYPKPGKEKENGHYLNPFADQTTRDSTLVQWRNDSDDNTAHYFYPIDDSEGWISSRSIIVFDKPDIDDPATWTPSFRPLQWNIENEFKQETTYDDQNTDRITALLSCLLFHLKHGKGQLDLDHDDHDEFDKAITDIARHEKDHAPTFIFRNMLKAFAGALQNERDTDRKQPRAAAIHSLALFIKQAIDSDTALRDEAQRLALLNAVVETIKAKTFSFDIAALQRYVTTQDIQRLGLEIIEHSLPPTDPAHPDNAQ